MTDMFARVLNMSLTAGVMILVVVLARLALRRAPRRCSYVLWSVVLFRLLCPWSLSSAVSILNVVREPVSIGTGRVTMVDYGLVDIMPQNVPGGTVTAPLEPAEGPLTGPVAQDVSPSVDWSEVMVYVWLGVAAVLIIWALVSYLTLRVRLWDSKRIGKRVYVARHIDTAFVMGIVFPRIYIPDGLTERESECVLAHERRHIRRGDHVIKLLAYAALCLHWFNPLVWLAWVLAMRDMEVSCDEAAIGTLGVNARADYAQTLLNLASRRAALGVSLSFGDDTKRRIKAIARFRPARRWISILAAVLAVAVIAGCAANPALVDSTPSQQTDGDRWADIGEYLDSLAAAMETVNYTNASGETVEAKVLDTDIESEKLAEVADLAPEGTLEAWSYSIYCKLDVDMAEVLLAGGQQYRDGNYYCFQPDQLVYLMRYSDGSCAILRDVSSTADDGYGSASQRLYDWYVTENGLYEDRPAYIDGERVEIEYPLYFVDWTEKLNGGNTTLGNFPAERYDGDGWYIYVPMQLWQYVGNADGRMNWVFGSTYGTGSSIIVEKLDVASEYDSVTAVKSDNGAEHQYKVVVPDSEDSHYVITASWNDESIALNEYTATEPAAAMAIADSFRFHSGASATGEWWSVDEYVRSLVASEKTAEYVGTDDAAHTANVLSTRMNMYKLAEVANLATGGTLEYWDCTVYYKLDAADDEMAKLAMQQYPQDEGDWTLDAGYMKIVALRYVDGSCDILLNDRGYLNNEMGKALGFDEPGSYTGNAGELLYDWYVTANGLDLPLCVLDWTDKINDAGYDYVSYTVRRYNGDGWYLYLPIGRWDETAESEPGTRWVYGNMYTQSDSTITVELVSGAAEDETNEEDFDDYTVLTRTVPAGEDSHWLITARWSAATVASSDMEIASDPGTARLAVESFTLE